MPKHELDKELQRYGHLNEAAGNLTRGLAPPGFALVFLGVVAVLAASFFGSGPYGLYVVVAALIAGYMALYIGANDVGNTMGPVVGGRALPLAAALTLAAICEAAGALLAGGEVVTTVSREIVQPGTRIDAFQSIAVMMAGVLAAAMWVHLATWLGAPVSTTHSVVGGILGAAIASGGFEIVQWSTIAAIALSWVVAPLLGGFVAALLFWLVTRLVLTRQDRVRAGRMWVPVMSGVLAGVFSAYLCMTLYRHGWHIPLWAVPLVALLGVAVGWLLARPWIASRARDLPNERRPVSQLFTVPLVLAAAILSFAHGANDVANAVGPLAAIASSAGAIELIGEDAHLPFWALLIGALGIAAGLAVFGPKVIRTVGERITRLDPSRAFCVSLSTGSTVLLASALGLPISTTHTAVGAVFGVGFLREAMTNRRLLNPAREPSGRFLEIEELNRTPQEAVERMRSRQRRRLVRRRYILSIGAAWIVTVPAAASLASIFYVLLLATRSL